MRPPGFRPRAAARGPARPGVRHARAAVRWQDPARRDAVELTEDVAEFVRGKLALPCLLPGFDKEVVMFVGAVGHPVPQWLDGHPQPRERPQQPPENQGEKAEHLNGCFLRMMIALGDLFRKNVND
jgi:hypothetical protein